MSSTPRASRAKDAASVQAAAAITRTAAKNLLATGEVHPRFDEQWTMRALGKHYGLPHSCNTRVRPATSPCSTLLNLDDQD